MSDLFMTYPGGKAGSGVYQKIINQMPPHRTYIEPFLGGGAIMRTKRPALINVGIDLDQRVIREQRYAENLGNTPSLQLMWGDAVEYLMMHRDLLREDCLVYCDPPYLMSTRSSQRQLYAFEMADEKAHRRLLEVLLDLRCMVMISGYWSSLYEELLQGWRTYSYQAMTRGGTLATEWLWMNYPEPVELHDYRFLGETFRERERIKRKKARWSARLERMPVLERQALLMAIDEFGSRSAVPGGDAGADDADMSASMDVGMSAESAGYDDAHRWTSSDDAVQACIAIDGYGCPGGNLISADIEWEDLEKGEK